MKKTSKFVVSFASLTLAASVLAFSQSQVPPSPQEPTLPDAAVVQKYHTQILKSLTEIEEAKVEAGIITQEWADAHIATIKAQQSDCHGECIVREKERQNAPKQGPKNMGKKSPKRNPPCYNEPHHNRYHD